MNKTIVKVFIILGIILLVFLIWSVFFNQGGVIQSGWNAMADGINGQYAKIAGDGKTIIPKFNDSDHTGEGGFAVDENVDVIN